jgi:hypothetical protein
LEQPELDGFFEIEKQKMNEKRKYFWTSHSSIAVFQYKRKLINLIEMP